MPWHCIQSNSCSSHSGSKLLHLKEQALNGVAMMLKGQGSNSCLQHIGQTRPWTDYPSLTHVSLFLLHAYFLLFPAVQINPLLRLYSLAFLLFIFQTFVFFSFKQTACLDTAWPFARNCELPEPPQSFESFSYPLWSPKMALYCLFTPCFENVCCFDVQPSFCSFCHFCSLEHYYIQSGQNHLCNLVAWILFNLVYRLIFNISKVWNWVWPSFGVAMWKGSK